LFLLLFVDSTIEAPADNVADFGVPEFPVQDGGKVDIWSAGLNWWLSPYLNVSLNYRYITLDRFGFEGNSQGFNSRLMLILE
jgi:phosphate-selective porin OprO/OprP